MIRKATAADLDGVSAIYEAVLDREEATGCRWTNWERGVYPCRATAEKALKEGTLYVETAGEAVVGCANLNQVQPPEYAKIPWTVAAKPREVLVIHTLCIHPDAAGGGWGRRFVAFAEGLAAGKGCRAMRLDTYEGNLPAISLYSGLGFHDVGITLFHFENAIWENLRCFEYPL